MKRGKVIGSSVPRAESVEKVTGKAVYAVDISLPNMLFGKVLRSPIAYGRIKRIDVSRALSMDGVKAVATGSDVAGVRIGRQIYDMPVLADGIVGLGLDRTLRSNMRNSRLCSIPSQHWRLPPRCFIPKSWTTRDCPGSFQRRAMQWSSCPGKKAMSKTAFAAPI